MVLTNKQSLFCKEYLIDKNATQAAIRAGYSKKTAESIGYENLRKPQIESRITKELAEQQDRTEVTADRVIAEIAKLAFIDVRRLYDDNDNLIPICDLPPEVSCAIARVDVSVSTKGGEGLDKAEPDKAEPDYTKKIKLWDKKGALYLLARHFNLLGDNGGIIPEGCYVQIYRPEKHSKERVEASCGAARGSV